MTYQVETNGHSCHGRYLNAKQLEALKKLKPNSPVDYNLLEGTNNEKRKSCSVSVHS